MSGHSKWAKLKHTKGASDAKKSKIFSRMANNITLATRQGKSGDPKLNFLLRDAIAKARAENLPQENIERAIKKGLGEDASSALEEVLFEAYGPEGSAILIKCITDKKNRTLGEIKNALGAGGGRLGEIGSVSWMFKETGKLIIPIAQWQAHPELEMELIDAGADSIETDEEEAVIYVPKRNLEAARRICESKNVDPQTGIEYLATNPLIIRDEAAKQKVEAFLGELSDLDDVQDIYTNAEF